MRLMTTAQTAETGSVKSRRERILDAAFEQFMTYGFKRTTMDDIARAASMSRPSLYQDFRNKNDIFRACVADARDEMLIAIDRVMRRDGPLEARLNEALIGEMLKPHRLLAATSHGEELLSVNRQIAGDLFVEWLDDIERVLSDAFIREAGNHAFCVPHVADSIGAHALARLMVNAIEGIKARMAGVAQAEADIRVLSGVIGQMAGSRVMAG